MEKESFASLPGLYIINNSLQDYQALCKNGALVVMLKDLHKKNPKTGR